MRNTSFESTLLPREISCSQVEYGKKMQENHEALQLVIGKQVPLKRFGEAEEVANTVLFLTSRKASFIMGACVVADGGQTRAF